MAFILSLIAAFLLGSIPFGLIYGRIFLDKDIREQGSGSTGATNATRAGGLSLGALTLASDIAKGMLSIYFAEWMGVSSCEIYVVALAALISHIFPVWLNFKGGKGIAVALSVIFMIAPWCAFNLVLIWGVVFYKARISSLASIIATISFLPLSWVYGVSFLFALITTGILLYAHKENLKALYRGEEHSFR